MEETGALMVEELQHTLAFMTLIVGYVMLLVRILSLSQLGEMHNTPVMSMANLVAIVTMDHSHQYQMTVHHLLLHVFQVVT